MDWTLNDWIIVFFFVTGALLHGITGFGYPIVGTAVIAGFYPLKTAVAMVVVPCLVINIMMLRTGEGFKHNLITYGRAFFPLFASRRQPENLPVHHPAVLRVHPIQPFPHPL